MVQGSHQGGINKNPIYSMIRTCDDTDRLEYRKNSCRPISKSTHSFLKTVKRLFTNNRSVSTRVAARKWKVSQSSLMRAKKDTLGIHGDMKRSTWSTYRTKSNEQEMDANMCTKTADSSAVAKISNPPNVPRCRGIEKFWALVKRDYHKYPTAPQNLRGFSQVWHM